MLEIGVRTMLSKISIFAFVLFSATAAWSHALMMAPAPRDQVTSYKTPECGGAARTATPTVLNPGQQYTVQIKETIDHPGRFYIDFSPAGDTNWQRLATILDDQNAPPVPHIFTRTITIPNTTCSACTLRVIQSMEENPAAPSLYYSCADIVISPTATASPTPPPGATPPPGGGGSQSGPGVAKESLPRMGGCGSMNGPTSGTGGGSGALLALLPLFIFCGLRRRRRTS
jgi:hypothetical protein